jgi:hypothetical protein
MPVKKIVVKPTMSKEDFGLKNEGKWFDEKDIQTVVDYDADVYRLEDDGKEYLLAKFRKKVIPKETVQEGWDAFRLAANPSRNRGAAAGPIDMKGKYWSKRKPIETDKWSTRYVQNGKTSKMRVNNVVASGVLGYYESTAFLDAACRMTSYTRSGLKNFLHGLSFIQAIDTQFKKLVPEAYAKQLAAVKKQPLYRIDDTAFSTVTVNMNFRTALHQDAGDFKEGFGNLTVIEWGKYHGAITMFPRFEVGFNVRSGDFLAMDVHEWHTNSPFIETKEDKEYNKTLPEIRTRDPETGVVGTEHKFQRLTFVCYFREKLLQCEEEKTKEYYKRQDFDLKDELKKAKLAEIATLPIPDYSGTLEEAIYAIENTSAGASAKLAKTRKRIREEKEKKTRKNKRV